MNDTFFKFQSWKVLIENQIGKRIKMLRTNNRMEICNVKFEKVCETYGIHRHKIVIGSPPTK